MWVVKLAVIVLVVAMTVACLLFYLIHPFGA